MKLILRYPKREERTIKGRRYVQDLLKDLRLNPESVLVIRGDSLLTPDDLIDEEDTVEIRPVMSGG